MACGKPVIGSAYGANNDIVKHGITGYLATSESDWIEYAKILLSNKSKREELGCNARKDVEKRFTIQSCYKEILDAFSKVLAEK